MKKLVCLLLVLTLLALPLTSRAAEGTTEEPTPTTATEPTTKPTEATEPMDAVSPASADLVDTLL